MFVSFFFLRRETRGENECCAVDGYMSLHIVRYTLIIEARDTSSQTRDTVSPIISVMHVRVCDDATGRETIHNDS